VQNVLIFLHQLVDYFYSIMDVSESIRKYNTGRNPALLQLKYKGMRSDMFRFYRGTCHLFYEANHADNRLNNAPFTWICGDLHLENFGSYKGDNRLVYFDINDFDEALLAPCLWDVSRFACSIIVAHKIMGLKKEEAGELARDIVARYAHTLAEAHARLIETETAEGVIKDLLDGLKERKRKDFIDKRTEEVSGKRRLRADPAKLLPIAAAQREKITAAIHAWASTQENPDFYKVHDVALRIAGTGSLGLERYILLTEGKGKDNHYLLDLKMAIPSSLEPFVSIGQPAWRSNAQRVITIQRRMQAISPALLNEIPMDGYDFVIKELQPSLDKLDLVTLQGKVSKLRDSLYSFADILAWDQHRSSGRQGSATADELIDFAHKPEWQTQVIDFALHYAATVKDDYETFCRDFDDGAFASDEGDTIYGL
jgi:uncharacterized protein (DUF2252 family)